MPVKQERILAKEILEDQWLEPTKMVKQFSLESLAGALDVLVKDILVSMLEWLTTLIGFKKQLQIISRIISLKMKIKTFIQIHSLRVGIVIFVSDLCNVEVLVGF